MEGKSLTLNYVIKQAQGQGTWWDGSQLYYWKESREMDLRLQMESSLDLCSKGNLWTGRTEKYRFHGFEFHQIWEARKEHIVQLLSKPDRTLIVHGGSREPQVFPCSQMGSDSEWFSDTDPGRKNWMEASDLRSQVQILLTTAILATCKFFPLSWPLNLPFLLPKTFPPF